MNTKYLLSTVLVFLATLGDAFPQSISIELSIEWTKGQDILNEDSLIVYPELTITYRNNSDTSYYFPKIYEDYDHFPSLPCAALWNVPIEDYLHPNYEKKALPPKDYPYSKYIVYIGDGDPVYEPRWEAVNDTILWGEERCSDVVATTLRMFTSICGTNFMATIRTLDCTRDTLNLPRGSSNLKIFKTGSCQTQSFTSLFFYRPTVLAQTNLA